MVMMNKQGKVYTKPKKPLINASENSNQQQQTPSLDKSEIKQQ